MENESKKEEMTKLPSSSRLGNLTTASGDEDLKEIFHNIRTSKAPAVINYGASWCHVCSQIHPAFCQLSNRDGERVDEMFGAGEERLHDRLWLHS